jgi:FkbM family methyltransferase
MVKIKEIFRNSIRGLTFKRKLPSEFGKTALYVSADARLQQLKFGRKAFDEELLKIAAKEIKSESVVWDIGANIGVFTFAAASIAYKGSVLAVEADTFLVQLLKKSCYLKENRDLNVQVLPTAISNHDGVEMFLIANTARAGNCLETSAVRYPMMEGVREKLLVPTLTMDTLLNHFAAPNFIKLDVEGAELNLLEGARKVLEFVRPVY